MPHPWDAGEDERSMTFHARLSLILRRFAVTFPIAFVLVSGIAFMSQDAAFVSLVPLWIALVIAWPYLSRRMGFDFPKAPVPRTSAPKPPLGMRLLRGLGKLTLALFILLVVLQMPLGFSFYHAETARRTLHVGMTEAEVLRSVTGWDVMEVVSHLSGSNADTGEVLAITFGTGGKGVYTINDYGTGDGRHISESEALAMIQEKVQGSDHWSFLYQYTNFLQRVHFSVAFGPDGRVTEVRAVGEPLS
ncbi:MAG TPA: hypothetical protein VFO46_10295 [Candidatus Sulfotelmatobacter sp.]|nr:hypothetical protein [Candidatus Sulfotelmatobacter sp.]